MNLPENYVVICETQEETNIVKQSQEKYKNREKNHWSYWKYCAFANEDSDIFTEIKDVVRYFKNKNISDYKTFTFKEWKEMKENKNPLEYWYIKITEETLDAVNKVRAKQKENNEPIKLNDYYYYGKSKEYSSFGGLGLSTVKEENLLELTLDEFKSYFLKEEYIFPKRWCILATEENIKEISDFFVKHTNNDSCYEGAYWMNCYFHSHCCDNISIYNHKNFNYCNYSKREGFEEISIEQFREHILKEPNNKTMKLIVSVNEVLEIHKIACSTWKTKIANYLTRVDSNQNISFNQLEINEMFKAATSDQKPVLTKIFGELIKPIEWDKIKTGSKVMLKETGKICNVSKEVDFTKEFDVIFYNTPYLISASHKFSKESVCEKYCTFHQDSKFVLFDANKIDYITEVIEY